MTKAKKSKAKAKVALPPGPVLEPNLYLSYSESRSGGEAINPEDAWPDHEDEVIEFYLRRANKSKENAEWSAERMQLDFDPEIGSTVWVLVVRYDTGGTFGRTLNTWTIIGVYKHHERASKVAKSIDDNTYDGYKCWQGYFERFGHCDIEGMQVEP